MEEAEKENIRGIIYGYQNVVNGKWYVGQTRESAAEIRHRSHRRGRSGCIAFNAAVMKYGIDSFAFRIFEDDIPTQEQLNYLEMFWIAELNTHSGNGYNISHGGGGAPGSLRSAETRRKISQNNARIWKGHQRTQEERDRISAALTGKIQSEETKQKKSESLARCYSEGRRVPINGKRIMNLFTKEVFRNAQDAATTVNGTASGLRTASYKQQEYIHRIFEYKSIMWYELQDDEDPSTVDIKSIPKPSRRCSRRVRCVETGVIYKNVSAPYGKGMFKAMKRSIETGGHCGGFQWEHVDSESA